MPFGGAVWSLHCPFCPQRAIMVYTAMVQPLSMNSPSTWLWYGLNMRQQHSTNHKIVRLIIRDMAKRYFAIKTQPFGFTLLVPALTTHGTAYKYCTCSYNTWHCLQIFPKSQIWIRMCVLNGMLKWLEHERTNRYNCFEFHVTTVRLINIFLLFWKH